MKTVFITGAGGFIGRNIQEQCKNKYHLLTPSKKELNLLDKKQVDQYFTKNTIDVVINSAVTGGTRPEKLTHSVLSENLTMFVNLLRNKSKYHKMIHFGSGAEYDKTKPIVKVKEHDFDTTVPLDDYGLYKYICSKYIEKEKNIVSLRIFGLYGKHEDVRYRFISNSIINNLMGKSIIINQNVFFDYVYIKDFIKIIEHFIDHKQNHKFYNIGTGMKIDLITIAHLVNSVSHMKSKIIIKKFGLGNEYTCDNSRLRKKIQNINFTPISEAIKELFMWYKQHQKIHVL